MRVPLYLTNLYLSTLRILLFGLLFFATSVVYAAEIELSPATGTYAAGQTFTTTVQIDPAGESVNAVEANLTFDTTKLSVVSVSKTGSAFSLWTTEPTFSNTAGTITFGGGSPSPFSTRSTLITVTLRTVAEGGGAITVSSASALAADGLGTDIYTGSVDGLYTITAASATPPPPPVTETVEDTESADATITFGEPPRPPEIGSTVFLDPEIWYATQEGIFTWTIPFDVDAVALDISTSSEYEPETIFDPAIEEFEITVENAIEGIQYITVQFKNQVGWGGILHRKLKIDTKPPESFEINVRAGNTRSAFPLLTFEAKDVTSGVERYEMTIAGDDSVDITPAEAELGYLLGSLEDGTYTIIVKAYDMAGNVTESSIPVLITAGWVPLLEIEEVTSVWDFFSGKNLVIILLLIIIIGEFVYTLLERRRRNGKEEKLRKEVREVQDQMEKIFSALRDEIYDQINTITKRPRLSKREKEAVEGLSQALEVSETLIEKEITDVQKILK